MNVIIVHFIVDISQRRSRLLLYLSLLSAVCVSKSVSKYDYNIVRTKASSAYFEEGKKRREWREGRSSLYWGR